MHLSINDQIHLTEFRPTDKAACVQHLSDREIYDRTLRIPYPYTEADFDNWLEITTKATEQHGEPIHFAIRTSGGFVHRRLRLRRTDQRSSGRDRLLVGEAVLGPGDHDRRGEQGLRARPRPSWKLVRITAHVFESNLASARVLEKNGFVCEGHLRKHYLKDGRFIDGKLYALVR